MENDAHKISKRLDGLQGDLPSKAVEALRKARNRGHLPSLGTLQACAEAKKTTVGYLLGETSNPVPAVSTAGTAAPGPLTCPAGSGDTEEGAAA